jgi:diguanylate cyclase (GGDEF)-like protein/PAS domain S-box-containing protein
VTGPDARLDALAAATGQAVIGMDEQGRIAAWGGEAERIFGWERDEVLGRSLADTIIPSFYRAAHRYAVERRRSGGGGALIGRVIEVRALRRGGSEFPVEMVVIAGEEGEGTTYTALLRDLTARKQVERLGEMQLAVSQLLMSGTGSGLGGVVPEVLGAVGETLRCEVVLTWVPEPGGGVRLEHVWHAGPPGLDALCTRARGVSLPQAELVGRMFGTGVPFVVHADMPHHNPLLALAEEFGLRWMAAFPIAHAGPPWGRLVLLSSGILDLDEDVLRAMTNVGGQLGQALARAEAERVARESERDLWHQAYHDQLTGLANRALFTDRVDHALLRSARHGSTCAVLLLDLDDFKRVNDTRGHHAGDRLVQAVARRICEHLRPEDSVARLGGDEFAVLLEDLDGAAGADVAAERMLASLQRPFDIDGRELLISASLGVALSADASGFDEILRNADLAMYVAKSRGKGRHQRFEQRMLSAMVDRVTLEHELRTALTRDQLFVLYQPQIDVRSGRITGAEALVRWEHPARGRLEPHAFIPQAEESRLIGALGARVLRTACWAARRWIDEGLPPGAHRGERLRPRARERRAPGADP